MKLILSPHPDDAEYSMSGTILKQKDTEWFVVTMSNGGDNDDTTGYNRIKESEEFWSMFPNVKCSNLNQDTIAKMTEWQLVSELDEVIPLFDTVYVPPLEDNHFEHRKINQVARAALRGLDVTLIEYYTPSTRHTWQPNLFVDVTEQLDEKLSRMRVFESQLDRFYFDETNLNIFHEDYFCRLRGLSKVEKFKVEYMFL
jgi:LmbE family N-acetylglucosaminyl deacetylase